MGDMGDTNSFGHTWAPQVFQPTATVWTFSILLPGEPPFCSKNVEQEMELQGPPIWMFQKNWSHKQTICAKHIEYMSFIQKGPSHFFSYNVKTNNKDNHNIDKHNKNLHDKDNHNKLIFFSFGI